MPSGSDKLPEIMLGEWKIRFCKNAVQIIQNIWQNKEY
jgi:hypothetical protein